HSDLAPGLGGRVPGRQRDRYQPDDETHDGEQFVGASLTPHTLSSCARGSPAHACRHRRIGPARFMTPDDLPAAMNPTIVAWRLRFGWPRGVSLLPPRVRRPLRCWAPG